MDLLKKMIMKGLLRKIEERWMVGTVCYADLWSNYIPLHPDDVKEIEEWLFDNPGVIYHSQEVEFEIVNVWEGGMYPHRYAKLIPSKEQQKQLITEIMELDAKDGLYADDLPTTTTDLIDGAICSLLFDERMKCWELIEKLIEEEKAKLYTEEQVKFIVEKSRETGLTAEYLMLSLKQPKKD
jgi:hypothetical protein